MDEIRRLFKFVIVGSLNSVIGYCSYAALIFFLHAPYLAALAVSWLIAMTTGFMGHRYWTFRSRGNQGAEIARFLTVNIILCLTNVPLLIFFIEKVHLNPYTAQIATMAILTTLSYIANRVWIFRHAR